MVFCHTRCSEVVVEEPDKGVCIELLGMDMDSDMISACWSNVNDGFRLL